MDAELAQRIAIEQVLSKSAQRSRHDYVVTGCVLTSRTWVVTYNTREYVETGDFRYALAGNGPVLVAEDGRVEQGGTAHPVEYYVEQFEGLQPEQ